MHFLSKFGSSVNSSLSKIGHKSLGANLWKMACTICLFYCAHLNVLSNKFGKDWLKFREKEFSVLFI